MLLSNLSMFITDFDVVTSGDLTISDVVICRYIAATEDLQMIANQQATPGKGVMSKATPPGGAVRCINPAGVALILRLASSGLFRIKGSPSTAHNPIAGRLRRARPLLSRTAPANNARCRL